MLNLAPLNAGPVNQGATSNVVALASDLSASATHSGQNIVIHGFTSGLTAQASIDAVLGFNQQMSAGLIANATTDSAMSGQFGLSREIRGFGFVRLVFDTDVSFSANLPGNSAFTGVFADAILSADLTASGTVSFSMQKVQRLYATTLEADATLTAIGIYTTAEMYATLEGVGYANLALVGDDNADVWLSARFLRGTATITESFDAQRVFMPALQANATLQAGLGRFRRMLDNEFFCQARFVTAQPGGILSAAGTMEAAAALAGALSGNFTLKPKMPNFQGNATLDGGANIQRRGVANVAGEATFGIGEPVAIRGYGATLLCDATLGADLSKFTEARLSASLLADGAFVGAAPGVQYAMAATLTAGGAAVSGFVTNPFLSAPAGRIIDVEPKDRELFVEPKDRAIVFFGDDEGYSMETRVKQPAEVVDYDVDMREWFKLLPGDSIASATVEIDQTDDPDDLEAGPGVQPETVLAGSSPKICKVWLGGGRDGVDYKVTVTLTTNGGRVEEVDFIVQVVEQ